MSLSLVLATSLALLPAADEPSSKADKLVGRWVCSQLPGLAKETKATLSLTFAADNKLTIVLKLPEDRTKTVTGTWKLGSGDKIVFENLSEPLGNRRSHDQTLVIKDKEMALQDSDGTIAVFKKE